MPQMAQQSETAATGLTRAAQHTSQRTLLPLREAFALAALSCCCTWGDRFCSGTSFASGGRLESGTGMSPAAEAGVRRRGGTVGRLEDHSLDSCGKARQG